EEWAAGTPNVATISGSKFSDFNGDGLMDGNDAPLAGVTIYLDTNGNHQLDQGELSTITDQNGNFIFQNILAGTYHVREVVPPNYLQTTPLSPDEFDVTVAPGQTLSGLVFGNQPQLPGIHIVKLVNGNDANSPPGIHVLVGST